MYNHLMDYLKNNNLYTQRQQKYKISRETVQMQYMLFPLGSIKAVYMQYIDDYEWSVEKLQKHD